MVAAPLPISSPYDPRAAGALCDRCPLEGRVVVPPDRARDRVELIVIGEGPGTSEVRALRPFVGPSGRLMDAALLEAGTRRSSCHVTNAVLCQAETEKELATAIPCCAPRLGREVGGLFVGGPAALKNDVTVAWIGPPPVVVSLGAQAARVVIGKAGVIKYRGFIWQGPVISPQSIRASEREATKLRARIRLEKGAKRRALRIKLRKVEDAGILLAARQFFQERTIVPTVHPAFILRGADAFRPVLRIDLKRAVAAARAERLDDLIEGRGKFHQTSDPMKAAKLLARLGPEVTVDIETDRRDPMQAEINCVGVADIKTLRAVILDPWSKRLAKPLREALKHRTCVTHNGPAFDVIALRQKARVKFGRNEDTLVAHRSFASHMPQSLAHVGSVYTTTIPWKLKFKSGEEKGAVAGLGVKEEDLAEYNAMDVRIDALSWNRMQRDIEPERAVYELDMKMAALFTEMQIAGIRVDQGRQRDLSAKLKRRAAGLVGEMRQLLDRRLFTPSKPNDIRRALYKQLKAPIWLGPLTPTGLPSTAAIVLEALRKGDNRAGKLADLIIRWRSANDSRSEYLDVYVHTDGRVHPTWKQVETGRPATRNPNLLNIPRMAHCQSCGVKLLDGCSHDPAKRKKRKGDDGVMRLMACDEPQPEEQLRDIYIAAKGCKLVYFDLSQAEMRFAAHISGDEKFIEACAGDIHAANACILFPDAAEIIRADPKGRGARFRDVAKNCGFAVTYLAEAPTVYAHLRESGFDVNLSDVETMLRYLHDAYRVYYRYVEKNVSLCRKQGFLRTVFVKRKRWLGFFPTPTTCANFPVQSGVADVMAERLLELEQRRTRNARLLIYHYDAAIYEVPDREVETMERIIAECWKRPVAVPHNELSFVQKIDQKRGERLSDF